MFQFDTKLFTLQFFPLKTDVYFLTIQRKDILYAKRTLGCNVGAHLSRSTFVSRGVTDVLVNNYICDKLEMRRMCSTHNRKDTRSTFVSHSSIKFFLKRKLCLLIKL
jgi:hypothetical protein